MGVASIVERASETMLIRLLKIDWPVGFAAAAEREREASICFRGINRRGGHPSNGIRGWERKLDGQTRGKWTTAGQCCQNDHEQSRKEGRLAVIDPRLDPRNLHTTYLESTSFLDDGTRW